MDLTASWDQVKRPRFGPDLPISFCFKSALLFFFWVHWIFKKLYTVSENPAVLKESDAIIFCSQVCIFISEISEMSLFMFCTQLDTNFVIFCSQLR